MRQGFSFDPKSYQILVDARKSHNNNKEKAQIVFFSITALNFLLPSVLPFLKNLRNDFYNSSINVNKEIYCNKRLNLAFTKFSVKSTMAE